MYRSAVETHRVTLLGNRYPSDGTCGRAHVPDNAPVRSYCVHDSRGFEVVRCPLALPAPVHAARSQGVLPVRRGGTIADLHDESRHRSGAQPSLRQLDHRRHHERRLRAGHELRHPVLRPRLRPFRPSPRGPACARRADRGHARLRLRGVGARADSAAVRPGHHHGSDAVLIRCIGPNPLVLCVARCGRWRTAAQHGLRHGSRH